MCFPSGASFYSSELAPGYFLIVLDTTDLSLSWPEAFCRSLEPARITACHACTVAKQTRQLLLHTINLPSSCLLLAV
eukprot:scaffold74267_cov14-Tisochrysis_lutea.AAC.1